MARYTYEQIVKMGKDKGARPSDINYTLKKYGINRRYNPLTDKDNWANLPHKISSNAKGMYRDAKTFGGYLISPLVDAIDTMDTTEGRGIDKLEAAKDAFIKSVNDDKYRKTLGGAIAGGVVGTFIPKLGTLGGALTGAGIGMSGDPKEFANALLSTYNTNLDELASGSVDAGNVVQGIFDNPLYTALDAAPLYGPKLVKGVNKSLEHAPLALRQLFPDEKTRAFNRQITNSLTSARARGQANYQGILDLEMLPGINRERLVNNILTNKTEGLTPKELELAKTIKNNLRNVETEFLNRGYADPEAFRDNAAAQYVMYEMPDVGELVHDDIYRIIRGEDLRTKNKLPNKDKINKIKELGEVGRGLYDSGDISWLSQKLAPITDEYGNVVARELAGDTKNYFATDRIVGKQSTKKLANVFDRTVKQQLDEYSQFMDIEDTVNNLVNNFKEQQGIGIYNGEGEIPVGKAPFSMRAFKEYIKTHGANIDTAEAINNAKVKEAGALLIDNLYLDMINNAFRKGFGNRRLLNAFKKAVLANPHWFIQNRVGNFSNNLMDGVTLFDYGDARKAIKAGLIPNELQYQTSYGAYINMLKGEDVIPGMKGVESKGLLSSIGAPVSRLKQDWARFRDSRKSLEDIKNLALNTYTNTSDFFANPFYKLEASGELLDRAANLVKQAKEYGKRNNVNWKDVLRKAKEDTSLFHELNTGVNKALGDYVGRNYAMSPGWYDFISETIPFYRFMTQTGRTTAHQLAHNPLGFMANITTPPRVGYNLSQYYASKYGLDPDQYDGGIPYKQIREEGGKTAYRTYGFEPLPFASVAKQTTSPTELASMLGPYTTSLPLAMAFMNRYGRTATSPRQLELKKQGINFRGKKYEQTGGELLSLLLNTFATNTHSGFRLSSKELPELVATFNDKGMYTPYDTNAWRPNEDSYKKTLPSELMARWFGIQSRQVGKYKPQKPSVKSASKFKRKLEANRNKR